ncbi:hypothetical protein GCM10011297_22160 [Bacterioplanes sanyensis]|uniref:hypothetical protein n=1 Tax=Bacterioplanes sanyensis TaxID=1249553 RepID=UPI001679DF5E|nr:hypothetical protein [Bacterioplanes sanyensis]GGY48699.1 hypothetical protein GCM10011297_22160 [Bacterioplanes sanyensis]
MDIELLEVSTDDQVVESEIFSFSSEFFLRLSNSEFSKLGVSVKKVVKVDGESVDFKLCDLSPFIRDSIVRFLEELLVDVVTESLDRLGESPSKDEFEEYTYDLKELTRFIRTLRIARYTYLKRVG